ncbi:hypothetical protein AYO20_11510 [Fonsecaea nubica]|uniref:Uncharacterized protein n=1 Tax=Fonsecaea nubica TaxID=856822 RepID=A0A178BRT1_9EURO|nr:hypothetical protein AYO20_11510 [Fonsecaea nubica]OAL20359.1 hypothetical protein AYO20_11510 [Fonsecaea nubica]
MTATLPRHYENVHAKVRRWFRALNDWDLHIRGFVRLEHVKSHEERVHDSFKPSEDESQKGDRKRKREKRYNEQPIKRRKKEKRHIKTEVPHIKEEVELNE